MLNLAGYMIKEQLYEGSRHSIYHGEKITSQGTQAVVLKVCRLAQPSLKDLASLQHEYDLLKRVNNPNIIGVHELLKHDHKLVLVLEDIHAVALNQYLTQHDLALEDFFKIALSIVDALSELHLQNIIHKDINPANIIIQPDSLLVKLIDFDIASQLAEEITEYVPASRLEGTLAYLSPEQTGRMNRPVDYRTDFYSLGITFFEMLTGRVPFSSKDPLEIVHSHIAQFPVLASQINSQVPTQLAAVIAKLLSKTPEERYASAAGLKADLLQCQQQWQTQKHIDIFPLGQNDIPDHLSISHKLYGREQQALALLTAFERIAQGSAELLLVTGYSGIGKSSLVREVHKPIVQRQGYYTSGKYDQLQRTMPYSAFISAFEGLVKQLLAESEEYLSELKQRLLMALSNNGQVIINVIPSVELIIGAQPAIAELAPVETQYRFLLTFQSFVRTLATSSHPLVIFLDDLQWIDGASLQLLQSLLLDRELKHVLIIGAYRDNEVGLEHPLALTLQHLQDSGLISSSLKLAPLEKENIQQLLIDSFNATSANAEPLAQLLLDKTHGNPFFINLFLKRLYQDHLLSFSRENIQWQWDIEKIQQQAITDNVVDFLIANIRQLPEETQLILQLAACIGHDFDFKTLSIISERKPQTLAVALLSAIDANLISSLNEGYKTNFLLDGKDLVFSEDLSTLRYCFIHDRIQQAAYQLIDVQDRERIHLQIARLLLKQQELQENDSQLFKIMDHFNQAINLITSAEEKQKLAQYNLWAGKKAKASNAYAVAQNYFQLGLDLLKPFAWQKNHELIFNLHQELAVCHYLLSNYEEAHNAFQELLQRTDDITKKLIIYEALCEMFITLNKQQQALDLGLSALRLVNIKIPKQVNPGHILLAVLKTNWLMRKRKNSKIVLQSSEDAVYRATFNLLTRITSSAFNVHPPTCALLICLTTQLVLRHEYTKDNITIFVSYSSMMMNIVGWYKAGVEFLDLYDQLKKQYGNSRQGEGKTHFVLGTFIQLWRLPLVECHDILSQGYQLAYEAGDVLYMSYCSVALSIQEFLVGKNLERSFLTTQKTFYLLETMNGGNHKPVILSLQNFTECLLGQESFAIEKIIPHESTLLAEKNKTVLNTFYGIATMGCFLLNHFDQAKDFAAKQQQYAQSGKGSYSRAIGSFYYGLLLLTHGGVKKQIKSKIFKQIYKNFQLWASRSPDNFLHYLLLLEAEMAKINNNFSLAMDLYDKAIQQAYKQDAFCLIGVANECAAKFYLSRSKLISARGYIQEAYYAYQLWGATVKCNLLKQQYSEWLQMSVVPAATATATLNTITLGTDTAQTDIDLLSILKSTQAISSEIQLDKLLQKLLVVLLQNAGAQRGVLLVKAQDQWCVEAEGNSESQQVYLAPTEFVDKRGDLPISLINQVQRSQQMLIIQSSEEVEAMTVKDAYLAEVKPQSILLLPILYQGQLKNILYLENRIMQHAFTAEHVQTLKLLASQAAISLENARLYYQATHDPLTGLANRTLLYQVFNKAITAGKRPASQKMAVLFMDMDGFKKINDTLGHEVGDKLLQHFAGQLKACLNENGLAVRLGGDEFVALVDKVEQQREVEHLAEQLLQRLKVPVIIQGHTINIASSIGISVYPDHGQDIHLLLHQADLALYHVKSHGKGHYRFYSEALNAVEAK